MSLFSQPSQQPQVPSASSATNEGSTVAGSPSFQDGQQPWSSHGRVLPLLLIAALLFLRLPASFVRPQFWAEDAGVLFLLARSVGWHSLLIPQPGYYIIGTRLIACLAAYLPALYVPRVYACAALFYTLLTAWFCLRARLDHLLDQRGRLALAFSLVLVPQSGEVLMKLINCQWIFMAILFLLILQQPPSKPGDVIVDFLGLLLASLTGPFIVFYAPWFLVRLRRVAGGWSAYNLSLIGAAWCLAALQLWSVYHVGAVPNEPFVRDPAQWLRELGYSLPSGLFFGVMASRFLGKGFYVISPLLLLLLGWGLWRGERKRFWAALPLLACGGLAYAGGLKSLAGAVGILEPFGNGGRYFYPFYLAAAWVIILYGYDASNRLRTAAGVAALMMLGSSASNFTITNHGVNDSTAETDFHWELYAPRLDAGEEVDGVPTLPDTIIVNFPAKPGNSGKAP